MLKPFFVFQNKKLKKIRPEEVICLSTEGNYIRIYLTDKTFYLVRATLSGALKRLPSEIFIKTHRSFAVSVYFIDTIARDHLTIGKESIPIAKKYYDLIVDQINIVGA